MKRRGETIGGVLAVVALLIVFFLISAISFVGGYDAGVIAATRGKVKATLVEQPDGTNRWKVERIE